MKNIHAHQINGDGMLLLGTETAADGKATHRYVKDLIAVGEYIHPRGLFKQLSITPERLNKWCSRFNAARANGVTFEVTQDHGQKAGDVLGYLDRVYIEGNRLMGVHEFSDTAGATLAARCKNVSVEIHPNYKDGKGNEYGEMVFKSSLVQQPVVPGQLPFIAASIAGEQADESQHLWLSSEITKESDMNFTLLSAEIGETVTDETTLVAAVKRLKAMAKAPEPAAPKDPALLSLEADNKKLRRGIVVDKATVFIDSLKGKVPAAKLETAKPILLGIFTGTDTEPSVLCMSATGGTTTPAAELLGVFGDLFADVKPLGDVRHLSTGQGDKPDADDAPPSLYDQAVAQANAARGIKPAK